MKGSEDLQAGTRPVKEGTHKKEKSQRKKQQIVSSFIELVQNKPWNRISVMELCRKTEITRGTFYLYYEDICDLMEQIETELLEDLKKRYAGCRRTARPGSLVRDFPDRFDCTPPDIFPTWYEFCRDNRENLLPLLDRKNGDAYFVRRLRQVIREALEVIMDSEGTAKDELRLHFTEICIELHLLSAQTWLSNDSADFLSVDDIVNLLNTMRVGSMYLSWRNGKENG